MKTAGRTAAERVPSRPSSQELLDAAAEFERENPALVEALRVFGISAAQYEKAVRAMNAAPTCTSASTNAV
jgi:hypothetical protein